MRHTITQTTLLLVFSLLHGCNTDGAVLGEDYHFLIEGMVDPSCACDGEVNDECSLRTSGVFDLAFTEEYEAFLEVNNVAREGINIDGMNIRMWPGVMSSGEAFYEAYMPAPLHVPAGEHVVGSFKVANPTAKSYIIQYSDEDIEKRSVLITIGVTMLGWSTEGREVNSQEFVIPVEVCFGCLVRCPLESVGTDGQFCTSSDIPEQEPCSMGMDEEFDCRYCVPVHDLETCLEFCSFSPDF